MRKKNNKYAILQETYIERGRKEAERISKREEELESFETNTFYHYADEYRKGITDENEIEEIDFTEKFWAELLTIGKMGELINININAPPTSGKSVTGMAIGKVIMKELFNKSFSIKDIDRDQQEFSFNMRKPELKETVRVIDEWNELEQTGENSSIERALYNYFSDVMAQRFVHKISCSPKDSTDKNALIYLEVISSDKVTRVNHCKLFYKVFSAGIEIPQLLGYVNIYVGDVLDSEWYKEYRRRKFEKMDLILQKGITRPRMLEYAELVLKVVEELKELTKLQNVVNSNIIKNYMKMFARKKKLAMSIVGEELTTREISGIIDLYKAYWKISKDINNKKEGMKKEVMKGTTEKKMDEEKDTLEQLERMREKIIEAIKIQEMELEEYKKINKKYNTILN